MGKKYLETKENSLESSVLGIWQEAAKKADELDEAKFSPKEIKMAIGIASDKRYAGGNMTGAVKAIEKMKRGLSDHPQVMAVLKRQNEAKLDPVNKKALKKDFDDRKDKDIDNDGDVDSSDKYLAKRRKAVSKAISKEENKLDEKKAKYLKLAFNSPADVKKVEKWISNNLGDSNPGFTGMYRDGKMSIAFEDVDDADDLIKTLKIARFKFMVDYREENELDEKKANFLRLTFNSPADVKKARKWMDQNLPGADQGFTGVDYRAKDIEFEGVDDAEDLMKTLKNARFKFKVDHREENELDVIENTMAKVREFKIQDMKAALAQVWGMKEGKNPFKKEEEEKPVITKGGKTLTGKKPAEIDVKPKIKE